MIRIARAPSRLREGGEHLRVLLRWPRRAPRAGGRCSEIRSVICALGLGHRRHQRAAAGRLGEPDVEAHVGLPVGREVVQQVVHLLDELAERASIRGVGALGGERRDAELDRQALVAGLPPARRAAPRTGASTGGGASATNVPPPRPRTACRWPLCRAPSAPGAASSARCPAAAQLALGRQPRPGLEQAELDRRAEPLDRLLERRLRAGRARRASLLERSRPSFTGARTPGRAPSR